MEQIIKISIPVMVVYVMFVVGLSLTWAEFTRLKQNPKPILLGSLGPFFILPVFAIALVSTLDLAPYIEMGILLIAICPGGGISNFYIYLARASTALSVSMTGMSSLLAIVMIPLLMTGFVMLELEAEMFVVPFPQLLKQLIVTMILPIAIGMWVRRKYSKFSTDKEKIFKLTSIAVVACLTIVILIQGPAASYQEWVEIIFVSIMLNILALVSGFLVAHLAGLNLSDRFTLMIEYAVQNIGIAIVIAVILMGQLQFATMAAIYFIVQLPMIAIAILIYRRRAVPVPCLEP